MFGRTRRMPAGPALIALSSGAPLLSGPTFTTTDGWLEVLSEVSIEPTGGAARRTSSRSRGRSPPPSRRRSPPRPRTGICSSPGGTCRGRCGSRSSVRTPGRPPAACRSTSRASPHGCWSGGTRSRCSRRPPRRRRSPGCGRSGAPIRVPYRGTVAPIAPLRVPTDPRRTRRVPSRRGPRPRAADAERVDVRGARRDGAGRGDGARVPRPVGAMELAAPVLRRVWNRVTVGVAVSEAAASFLRRAVAFGGARDRAERRGRARPSRTPEPRADLPAGRRILWVNRLDAQKGFPSASPRSPRCSPRSPTPTLIVVGEGQRPRVAPAPHGAARERVDMLGAVANADVPAIHAACDVFVASAVGQESFGIVLVEAMAAGLPVVASDIPGYREVVHDGVDGLLVPPRDPEALAAGLARVLREPELATRLGEAGRERARAFDWPIVVDRLEELYGRAIESAGYDRSAMNALVDRARDRRGRAARRRLDLQPAGHAPDARRQRLVADRRAAPSPGRPDPEPGRDREGLRDARARALRARHRGARAVDRRASGVSEQADAENQVTAGLRQLLAVVENYPDLKANENFLALQEELVGTESKIAYARQFYNDQVMRLNTLIQSFPSSLVAGAFGFDRANLLRDRRTDARARRRWTSPSRVRADRVEQAQDRDPVRARRSSSSAAWATRWA